MWDESKHNRDKNGRFSNNPDGAGGEHIATTAEKERLQKYGIKDGISGSLNKKLTPAEKIASVHIDFDRDNILPELNEEDLVKIGSKNNKPVLLKASTIKRNLGKHFDVSEKVMQDIITETLYNPIDIFPANPKNPNYYHLAAFVEIQEKKGLKMGLLLLDIDESKAYFDVGHAYFVDGENFDRAKKKAEKKD